MAFTLALLPCCTHWTAIMQALAGQLHGPHEQPRRMPASEALEIAAAAAVVASMAADPLALAAAVHGMSLAAAPLAALNGPMPLLAAALAVRTQMTAAAAAAGWAATRRRVIAAGIDSGGIGETCTVLCAQMLDSADRAMRAQTEAFAGIPWCAVDADCLPAMALLADTDPDPARTRASAMRYATGLRQHGFAAGAPLLVASCLLARWHARRPGLMERFLDCARRLDASQAWPFFTPAIAQLAISPIALDDLVPHVVAAERSHTIPLSWHVTESSRQVLAALVARQDLQPAPSLDEIAAALAALALTEQDDRGER